MSYSLKLQKLTLKLNVVFQCTSPVPADHRCLPLPLPALHIGSAHKHTQCSWSHTGEDNGEYKVHACSKVQLHGLNIAYNAPYIPIDFWIYNWCHCSFTHFLQAASNKQLTTPQPHLSIQCMHPLQSLTLDGTYW